ncbi:FAD-binding oxidoreductase [Aestuariimicrobium sp. p3-SID1156]|uniref:FAD-binding oxidoreductase n=1 Tax=Aestuariimicrobium sp. p3-SID1156 TaxID=2916038 RepID=UPI00223C4B0B|nr:FAD-binding oxidoreductase [Aestuariimicrobium sp. p3-SID1156]MCT1458215.1 FAD-binding oxidoreductase [Aestuariimicrobium sp. p3-SID1156]
MTALAPDSSTAPGLRNLDGVIVHLAGDPGFDAARLPWACNVDQTPVAVVEPRSVAEVVRVVHAAREAGLRIMPQATGHHAGALTPDIWQDTVLMRLGRLDSVTIDPEAGLAVIGPGALWQHVLDAAAPHGFTANHGSAPDVAAIGFLLGGGIGWYSRRYGLGCNQLRSAQVVTASGDVVRCSDSENADLFWAVRGGGGSFGIVTSVELQLLPHVDVPAGMLAWDRSCAAEVVPAWVRWTGTVPDTATTSLRLLTVPPLPEVPEPVRGRELVVIDGAILEDDRRAAELLEPLRALSPEIDTFARIPAPAVTRIHLDPEGPTPSVSDHALLTHLDDAAVEAFITAVPSGSPLLAAELRHLGGALGEAPVGAGAVGSLAGQYALFTAAIAATPEMAAAGVEAGSVLVEAMQPWSTGRRFANFTNRPAPSESLYPVASWERLGAIRDQMDPDRLLVLSHPIGS